MKKLFFTLLFAIFSLSLSAQQVANGGFENWANPINPDNWTTLASGFGTPPYTTLLAPLATRDATDFYVGAASVKLTTTLVPAASATLPGIVGLGTFNQTTFDFSGIAFPYRPDTLWFAAEYAPTGTDTAAFHLELHQGGNIVAGDSLLYIIPTNTWGLYYVPLTWSAAGNADSLFLEFYSSAGSAPVAGSVLHVDTVFFTYPPTPPTISLSVAPTSIPETGGAATFTATLSHTTSTPVTFGVNYSGTATLINDYTITSSNTTIPAGSLSATISIGTVNDVLVEGNETIIATLVNPVGATIGTPSSVIDTIIDDDTAPTVSISASPTSISENGGTSTITATLSHTAPANVIVTVTYTGTATNGTDYTATTTINIPAGSTTGSVTVTATDNSIIDGNRTVIATASSVSPNATLGSPSNVTITIIDDDTPPTVSISASPISISENGGTSTITATLSHATSSTVTVTLTYSGTAASGDYTATTTITIPAGSTTGSVTLTAIDNLIIDGNRTVIATESVSPNATLGSPSNVTITIIDDDTPPTVSISASPISISENGGTSTITATLSHATSSTVTVTLTYSGTAVSGDYTAATTITIPVGSTTGSVTVTGIDNSVIDGNRTVIATESVSPNATLGSPSTATITITDDDAPTVSISVDSAQIHENGGIATVTITMSHPNPLYPVTANLIYGGSATLVGPTADYIAPGSVVIPAGNTTTTFMLSTINDALVEGSETIIITISNASNGTGIGSPSTAVVTILDDDTAAGIPYLSITPSSSSVTEGANVTLTASLSALSPNPVTASVVFTGTAVVPNDYSASATSVTIPAGSLTATITLFTVDDIYYEGTRIVFASLAEVTGGALLGQPATASVSILDNESTTAPPPPPPVLPIDSGTLGISNVNVLEAIKVYPVPAQDFVKVSLDIDVPQIVTLVDIQGRLVKEMPIVSGENTIDLSSVNSGTYILRFTNEQYNYFTGAKPITVVK